MTTITLTSQQQAAVEMPKTNPISILTGKPGTGKTTTVKAIIDWFEDNGFSILQCAPTGKAAKRMIESTGRPASTIHSALGATVEYGEFVFSVNEDNPWYVDLVIIDEASMITTDLFCHVLRGIDPEKTKLLLVGDTGQLPSVGAGAVLRDLIESGVIPHVELDVIHRNSGKIVEACAAIHGGKSFSKASKIDLEAENKVNLIHIDCQEPEMIRGVITTIVTERMPLRGYDSTWDVQVISPVNSKGELSCESLNKALRSRLNNAVQGVVEEKAALKFLPGDKVINTKNMKAMVSKKTTEVMVVNGDIGEILMITDNKLVVEFYDPERVVEIDRGKNHLLHAYCITCHRFQGSEAPVIVIPVHRSFSYFANRSWIYTAISRARDICITVGDFSAIEAMIRNIRDARRVTMLQEKIKHAAYVGELMTAYEGV